MADNDKTHTLLIVAITIVAIVALVSLQSSKGSDTAAAGKGYWGTHETAGEIECYDREGGGCEVHHGCNEVGDCESVDLFSRDCDTLMMCGSFGG